MKRLQLILSIVFLLPGYAVWAQPQKTCCADTECQQKAIAYAVKISGLVNFLGSFNETDVAENETKLNNLQLNYKQVYYDLVKTVHEIADYFFDKPRFANSLVCFTDALPVINKSNVVAWINYFRSEVKNPRFPSTEFCGGWQKRFEIAQGATAFLSRNKMAYLGTVRGYLVYTFQQKDKCGGNFRLMAGPSLFLRNRNAYITLSTRLGMRLADLKASVFSFGNLNVFGGYNTNFDYFSYAEGGLEAELGPFGVNLSSNYNTHTSKFGFMVGIVFGNKKL